MDRFPPRVCPPCSSPLARHPRPTPIGGSRCVGAAAVARHRAACLPLTSTCSHSRAACLPLTSTCSHSRAACLCQQPRPCRLRRPAALALPGCDDQQPLPAQRAYPSSHARAGCLSAAPRSQLAQDGTAHEASAASEVSGLQGRPRSRHWQHSSSPAHAATAGLRAYLSGHARPACVSAAPPPLEREDRQRRRQRRRRRRRTRPANARKRTRGATAMALQRAGAVAIIEARGTRCRAPSAPEPAFEAAIPSSSGPAPRLAAATLRHGGRHPPHPDSPGKSSRSLLAQRM